MRQHAAHFAGFGHKYSNGSVFLTQLKPEPAFKQYKQPFSRVARCGKYFTLGQGNQLHMTEQPVDGRLIEILKNGYRTKCFFLDHVNMQG